jgi:hypothetical protein
VQLRTTLELFFTTTQTPRTLFTTLTQHFALPRSSHSPESSLRLSQTSTITHATYEPLIHSFLLLMCSLCKHASQTTLLDTVVEHTKPSSCLSFLSIITHPLLRPPVPHPHTPPRSNSSSPACIHQRHQLSQSPLTPNSSAHVRAPANTHHPCSPANMSTCISYHFSSNTNPSYTVQAKVCAYSCNKQLCPAYYDVPAR